MTETTQPQLIILPCGLRLVYSRASGRAEYFGCAIDAGSRDETPQQEGLAHFVEHTIFKGTGHRRAHHIIKRMESVGGELNAYTTKEETYIYSVFPTGAASRAIQLIADLVIDPIFPEKELAKEREVVAEEISSYLDTPAENVFDLFDEMMFRGSSLAHNILGNEKSLEHINPEQCRQWVKTRFTPKHIVLFYCGNASISAITSLAERYFKLLSLREDTPLSRTAPPPVEPRQRVEDSDSHQAHTAMGIRLPSIDSPSRISIELINNIIGGPGMNSMLNIALRERRGLVYAADSSATFYSDCGLLSIYFGCDRADSNRCIRITRNTLQKIPRWLTPYNLRAAKRQFAGQQVVASENVEQRILSLARVALRGLSLPIRGETDAITAIMRLEMADVMPVAEMIAESPLSSLTI